MARARFVARDGAGRDELPRALLLVLGDDAVHVGAGRAEEGHGVTRSVTVTVAPWLKSAGRRQNQNVVSCAAAMSANVIGLAARHRLRILRHRCRRFLPSHRAR